MHAEQASNAQSLKKSILGGQFKACHCASSECKAAENDATGQYRSTAHKLKSSAAIHGTSTGAESKNKSSQICENACEQKMLLF